MELQPLLLDVALAGILLVVFVADLFLPVGAKRGLALFTAVGLTLLLAASFQVDVSGTAFGGAFVADSLALWFKRLFLASGALAVLLAVDPVARGFAGRQGEYYVLLLSSLLGMSILASAREMILIVVSFELMSLPLYALAAFAKGQRPSIEAAIKFFLVGAVSIAVTLYGLSLVYGATGTTQLAGIAQQMAGAPSLLLALGLFITFAGLAFKIGAVPFHMWIPDAYEGAPTVVVSFLSVAPKAAGFAVLVRVYLEGFAQLGPRLAPVLVAVCALTLLVGNLFAIRQTNVKRLLAYSGIAQIGYMLLAMLTVSNEGLGVLLFYLVAYLFTNLGAFAVVAVVGSARGSDEISAYRGLARSNPALSLAMLLFLLSLGGIPFVAGFWAKLGVFIAAWNEGHAGLVLLGAVLAVVGVFYYLRVARSIYLDEPEAGAAPLRVPATQGIVIFVSAAAIVAIGVWPAPLFTGALAAARSVLP